MKKTPWWVRLSSWFLQREALAGHLKLTRPMTYHECLQIGCTELEALDYINAVAKSETGYLITWRGETILRSPPRVGPLAYGPPPEEFRVARAS